ncbi:GTP-binding protein [Dyella sp. A6]|uniref:GTP-binding protein n=1 Tax=Dyella aluminiiresistens TaxID=3069105 RepID=UPI002E75A859|nr:ATP/GTP-binding protein [Dyella sp. A6]
MDNYQNKLVFVGHVGAGKTTAIRSISDVPPVSTEMPMSSEQIDGKLTTTVALDYSTVELDDGELLHIYGVPGQKYLDFMWPMVCHGAMGIIVLVNACSPQKLTYAALMLEEFSKLAPHASFAVGVTRSDLVPSFRLDAFRNDLITKGFRLPVVKVDAREPEQVDFLVKILLSSRFVGSQIASA